MLKTNPNKKNKYKAACKTKLIFCEGLGESAFLRHLKSLYSRDIGVKVKIVKGRGGAANQIVNDAAKVPGAFDKRIVVLDDDKPKKEMGKAKTEADEKKISLIKNTPCLEYVFLSILSKKTFPSRKSIFYKSEFESKFIKENKRDDPNEYKKVFTKNLLDDKRTKIPQLNEMIILMEKF